MKPLRDWDDLRVFLAVARSGSFTEAARQLKLVQTTVGRRMAGLEHHLGGKLFTRHRTGMRLTERGAALAERAAGLETAVDAIERHILATDHNLNGAVSVAVTDGLASYWLIPRLLDFHARYPGIKVAVLTTTSQAELTRGDADIAVRYTRPTLAGLTGRKVATNRFALYASAEYLSRRSAPSSLDELAQHGVIENANHQGNPALAAWHDLLGRRAPLLSGNSAVVLQAVRAGLGISLLPTFFSRVAPELVELDLGFRPSCDVWLLSHVETNGNARVRAMLTYLSDLFARDRRGWFG